MPEKTGLDCPKCYTETKKAGPLRFCPSCGWRNLPVEPE